MQFLKQFIEANESRRGTNMSSVFGHAVSRDRLHLFTEVPCKRAINPSLDDKIQFVIRAKCSIFIAIKTYIIQIQS